MSSYHQTKKRKPKKIRETTEIVCYSTTVVTLTGYNTSLSNDCYKSPFIHSSLCNMTNSSITNSNVKKREFRNNNKKTVTVPLYLKNLNNVFIRIVNRSINRRICYKTPTTFYLQIMKFLSGISTFLNKTKCFMRENYKK